MASRGAALGAKMNGSKVAEPFKIVLLSSLTMPNNAFVAFFQVADALFAIVHFFCNLYCTWKAYATLQGTGI